MNLLTFFKATQNMNNEKQAETLGKGESGGGLRETSPSTCSSTKDLSATAQPPATTANASPVVGLAGDRPAIRYRDPRWDNPHRLRRRTFGRAMRGMMGINH